MKNNEHQLDKLIENYLKNESTPGESSLLDHFTERYREKHDWEERQMGNKAKIGSQIRHRINQHTLQNTEKSPAHKYARLSISIAASVIVIIGSIFWIREQAPPSQLLSMETGAQMDSLKLSDGSVLYLSPQTSVSCNKNFNRTVRKIELTKGNAFFKVARNPQKPFVIRSGGIVTKVLGTSFNIQVLEEGCRVTVYSGKVNVSSVSGSVDLVSRQEAGYSNTSHALSVSQVAKDDMIPWYNADVAFNDKSLKTVLKLVEKKYGVEMKQIGQEHLSLRATVFIAKDASLGSVLEQINYITNLKLEVHGKEINCKNEQSTGAIHGHPRGN